MKSHASMNRIYRLVWNAALGLWVAVAENAKGRSKGGSARSSVDCSCVHQGAGGHGGDGGNSPSRGFTLNAACRAAAGVLASLAFLASQQARAADAANAAVVSGAGTVATAGNVTTINQATQKLAIDWTSLSTRANEALVFNQPNASAIALNRIIGSSPSEMLGSLTANGQVFILNPNGVLFGAGSQVNVGGLVASTMSLSNADFEAGNFKFSGSSTGSVINQGTLTAAAGGYLALLAPEVRNEGVMVASLGTALLAAGNKVTLNLDNGSLLGYSIDQGAINALAENKQLIKADGGQVLLSARAMDSLTTATVNNTGIIEAKTLQNKAGRILLMGDMETGTVNVAGTLDASASTTGNGGFVETSAAHVKVATGTKVTTLAADGKTGKWLIDPNDFTIASTGGDMDAATVASNLATTDFEIATATMGATSGNGDINVNEALSWSSAKTLTLTAQNDININQAITATNGGLTLNAVGAISAPAAVNIGTFTLVNGAWSQLGTLPAFSATDFRITGGSFLRALGGDGNSSAYQITDIYGLQGVASLTLNYNYELANNIDASGTSLWNAGAGFNPIGRGNDRFTGTFDGQGYDIAGLFIDRPTTDNVGLFGTTRGSSITNINLVGGSVSGSNIVGTLVGALDVGSTFDNNSSSASARGSHQIGGLVGFSLAAITNSHSSGAVDGIDAVGGLVGESTVSIAGSYSESQVTAYFNVGGLVGFNHGNITNSYAAGNVSAFSQGGGLVGTLWNGAVSQTYSSGRVEAISTSSTDIGGLVGLKATGNVTNSVTDSYWNIETSGRSTSAGGTGKTTAQMTQAATFVGWNIDAQGGTGTTWRIYEGQTAPLLRSFLTPANITIDYDGSGALLANIGSYTYTGPALDSSKLLGTPGSLVLSSSGNAGTYAASLGLYSNQQGYDLGTRIIASPGSAIGEVKAANINYTDGTLIIRAAGDININSITSADGSVALSSGGNISASAVDVGMFDLKAGSWRQVGGTLPSFSATDFRISGGSFVRALSGNGSTTPYLIADVYGLQGSGSAGMLGNNYAQANNIDASGTASWNAGAGFKPVGNSTTGFSGSFNGQGYSISGLVINRPFENGVGLFGVNNQGTLRNINLDGGSITGYDFVGALAGQTAGGTLENNTSSAAVTGHTQVGGLAGLSSSYLARNGSSGAVNGILMTGGLVGDNSGFITGSYASGDVSSTDSAGGLVGRSLSGDIADSYASGMVTAINGRAGGLVGSLGNGRVTTSYATGLVTDRSGLFGGGIAGYDSGGGSVIDSYWNTETTGQSRSAGGTGKTTGEMTQAATFAGWDVDDVGGTGKTWRIYEGNAAPLLRSFLTPIANIVTPDYDGSGTLLANIGSFTVINAGADPKILGTPDASGSLTLSSSGVAGSYLASVTGKGLYSTQQGYDILSSSRLIASAGSAANDVRISNPISWTNGTLAINAAGDINLNGKALGSGSTGVLTLNAAGSIENPGAVSVGTFELQSGFWHQEGSALPSFSANDFRITGGGFLRTPGGDGSSASPYQIADVYGLQGIASLDRGNHYLQSASIDASGTSNWNAGAGFRPIGDDVVSFGGNFNGQGYNINGLVINRPDTTFVGLFGFGEYAYINNVNLRGGSITGGQFTGGIVGFMYAFGDEAGRFDRNSSSASVYGAVITGGLIGRGFVDITNSYVTNEGNDSGTTTVYGGGAVGGLVGNSRGNISNSYTEGDVYASTEAGGLVGRTEYQSNSISNSYSSASVSGGSAVGGLVGRNNSNIINSYSTGRVSGSTSTGGLVGAVGAGNPTIENSFWNTETSGQSASAGGTGKTTNDMLSASTFTGWSIDNLGGTGKTWRIYEGQTAPLLRSFLTPVNMTPDYDGSGTLMANIGSYTYAGPALDAGKLLGEADKLVLTSSGDAGTYLASVGWYSHQHGYDIGGTRTIASPGSAIGEVKLANPNYTSGILAVNATGDININSVTSANGSAIFRADGDINIHSVNSANGGVTFNANGDININNVTSGSMAFSAGDDINVTRVTSAGAGGGATFAAGGDINVDMVNVGLFDLKAGSWRQVGGTLPSFSATDFRISGGSFLRALGGDGSTTPYLIADAYGLQGVGSLLGNNFAQAGNIDASGTTGWNSGTGFKPIGDNTTGFSGSFDGQGYRISGLFINSNQNRVGLFGSIDQGTVRNTHLDGGSITGFNLVGGLAGQILGGTFDNNSSSATVTGNARVGGLAGLNNGTISNSSASGFVNGFVITGGLVGQNSGMISSSYAAGDVNGSDTAGGLVGYNTSGSISNSYATGRVTTLNGAGGLVGELAGGNVTRSYATGLVTEGSGMFGGGLIGYDSSSGSMVSDSYWDTQTSGYAYSAGGTGKTTAEMKQAATFAGWDIANAGGSNAVWRIYEGNTGPLLRSFLTARTLADTVVTYDGTTQTVTAAGVLGAGANGRNAGTYNSGFYSTQDGYDLSGGDLVINKASLTLAAATDSKTYDGTTASTAAVSRIGLASGDTVTGLAQSFANKNVMGAGASTLAVDTGYTVSDGNNGGNYNVTSATASGTINKAALTVTANAVTRTYDGTTAAAGTLVTTGTIYSGDSLSGGSFAFANKNASIGDKVLNVSGVTVGDGVNNGNYNVTYVANTTSTINKATLNITATPDNKIYDGTTAATASYTDNRIAGDMLNYSASASFASKDAGTGIAVNVGSITPGGADAGNYTVGSTTVGNTADITPKTLTVTANDDTRIAGVGAPYSGGNGVTYSGIVAGETVAGVLAGSVAYSGDAQGASLAGDYDITPGGLTASSNYTLRFVDGSLRLTAADANSAALGGPALVGAYNAALGAIAGLGGVGGGGGGGGGGAGGTSGGGSGSSNSPNAAGNALNAAAFDSGSDGGDK